MVPVLGPVWQHAAAVAMMRSQFGASVWMSWAISNCCYLNVLGSCGQRQGVQSTSSAPAWSWMLQENSFISRYGEGNDMFYVIVFNRCPRSPWVRLLLSQTRHRTFEMAPCDTSLILDISHWKSPRPENRTIFSMITCWILVGVIATLVSDGSLHAATVHGWMWSTQMRHSVFEAIGELSTPAKEGQYFFNIAGDLILPLISISTS